MYYVYFLKSLKEENYFYVGMTSDIIKRLKEHNSGKTKSLRSKIPLKLVYSEEFEDKKEARKRELRLKSSWSTKKKIIDKLITYKALSSNG